MTEGSTLSIPASLRSLNFDGVDDRINFGLTTLANLTNNFTVAAWIRPDVVTGVRRIVNVGAVGSGGWGFGLDGSQLMFTTHGVRDYRLGSIASNTWTHVAATMRSNNSVEFFVNGTSIGSLTHTAPGTVTTNNLFIGSGNASQFFDGRINDVGVWAGALTASQLDVVRRGGLAALGVTPLAFWKLDEGSGTTVSSTGPTTINGTILGGAAWGTDVTVTGTFTLVANGVTATDDGVGTVTVHGGSFPVVVRNVAPRISQIPNLNLANFNQGVQEGQTLTVVPNATLGRFDFRIDGTTIDQLIVTDPSSSDLPALQTSIDIVAPDGTVTELSQRSHLASSTSSVSIDYRALHEVSNFSIGMWIKTTSTARQTLLSAVESNFSPSLLLQLLNDQSIQLTIGPVTRTFSIPSVANDVFRHILVTLDGGANTVELFLDGVSQGKTNLAEKMDRVRVASGGLILGQEQTTVGGGFVPARFFVGNMDDVQIWSRTLQATEALRVFNNQVESIPDFENDLRARLSFNELPVGTAIDSSRWKNDAIVSNGSRSNLIPSVFVPQVTMPDNGIYTLRIKTVDDEGGLDSTQRTFNVTNVDPFVNSINQGNFPVAIGRPMTFNAGGVVDPGIRDTFTYLWEVTSNNGQKILSSSDFNFEFTPEYAGTYSLLLTVTDSDGGVGTRPQNIQVRPVAAVETLTSSLSVGSVVTLDSQSSSTLAPAGGLLGTSRSVTRAYAWKLQRGSTTIATGSQPTFSFVPNLAGNYTASLIITDEFRNNGVITATQVSAEVFTNIVVGNAPIVTIETENDLTTLDFDGTDDQVEVVSPSMASLNGQYSVAAWIKPGSVAGQKVVIGGNTWRLGTSGSELTLDISTNATGSTRFVYQSTGANLRAGIWSHIAAVRRTDLSVEFFVDGRLIGTVAGNASIANASAFFTIGSRGFADYFDGMIREVGVWATALTLPQLDQVRVGEVTGTDPLSFWKLDESSGNTASAVGSNPAIGSLVGNIARSSHVNGVEGDILEFTLGNLPDVDELGSRVVVWNILPTTFELLPSDNQKSRRIRLLADGIYTVDATVTDSYTSPDFQPTQFVRVANRAYITAVNTSATIIADDLIGSENVQVTLTATVVDPGASDTHTYVIQWSDGGPNSTGSVTGGSISVNRTFPEDGLYQAIITVTDNAGASRTETVEIDIRNSAPTASNDLIAPPVSTVTPVTTTTSSNAAFTVSATDLAHGAIATITNGPLGSEEGASTNVGTLTDGAFGVARTSGTYPDAVLAKNNLILTYNLNIIASPYGYDLTGIETYTGWRDTTRDRQNYTLRYSTIDDPNTFIVLTTVNFDPSTNTPSSGKVSIGGGRLAARVAAVQFQFTNTENGYVGYREIDIFGTPSTSDTIPSTCWRRLCGGHPQESFLRNDKDPSPLDQAALAIHEVPASTALGATISRLPNGDIQYDPTSSRTLNELRAGQSLTDSFVYSVIDRLGAISAATLSIVVPGMNDAPIGSNDENSVVEDATVSTVQGNLLANDRDPDLGSVLTVQSVNGQTTSPRAGLYGTLTWNADGTYSYALDNTKPAVQQLAIGQTLAEVFNYTLTDGLATAISQLTIRIHGTNDAPVARTSTSSVVANGVIFNGASAFDDAVLADAPIAYWRLNDLAGTVAANRMAPITPDGVIVGGEASLTAGLLPNSPDSGLRFDGTRYVSIPNSSSINSYAGTASAKTIELWFKADSVQGRQVLYEQGNATSGLNLYIDAGRLYFGTWNANVFGPNVQATVVGNAGYHVVAVYGDSTARLYVNGAMVASGVAPASIASHPGETAIGAARTTRFHDGPAGNGFQFIGTIDELALYNASLTPSQVAKHFAAAGLLAGYRDADSADTAKVIAVNGLSGNVGRTISLGSGALLTVHTDGSYEYDPNGAFDHLAASGSGTEFFDFTIEDAQGPRQQPR